MSKDFQLPAYGWSPRIDQLPLWNAALAPGFKYANICAHRRWGGCPPVA